MAFSAERGSGQMHEELRDRSEVRGEPLAIVGVGCRLPGGVRSLDALLQVFREGRDCITEVPASRWPHELFYDPDPRAAGKTYARHGGFLADVDSFDSRFFDILPLEAERMDPQQRILLETTWHALEDAGQATSDLGRDTGVFVAGMNTNDYAQLGFYFAGIAKVSPYDLIGHELSVTAGRVSHFFGLHGPCLTVNTACSGGMVALHLARQSLLAGECDTAIVAGVGTMLHPGVTIAFSRVGLMSRTGRCRPFDEQADGYVRGEGCVVVILRRLALAEQRGDRVLGCLLSTAINHDGRTPMVTTPNGRAQEAVMRTALARAGVAPADVGYVEAHGTGTPVGDPIEMGALANVFGPGRSEPLAIGSSKSNFGHIEAGAGLLGLVKALLSVHEGELFPTLHFQKLSSTIEREARLRVPTTRTSWPFSEGKRIAGINSFGYSGTNAHALLEETPKASGEASDKHDRSFELLVLSAKSEEALFELAASYGAFLVADRGPSLADIAFSAATGRTHLPYRLAVIGREKREIADAIKSWSENGYGDQVTSGRVALRAPQVAFVFSGQGTQRAGMGATLYRTQEGFRRALSECSAALSSRLDVVLEELLFGSATARLESTEYTQPALFCLEYALAAWLQQLGVEPRAVVGHSVGELVAACVAGALELDDALELCVGRARLMAGLPRNGKMMALDASEEEARTWIAEL
ncbi:MAG TPA: type I polyketide synthase, partial [Polyangiaceae bacterium]|nr:type I polyketide synthase [Polyangiaceae bacterium]